MSTGDYHTIVIGADLNALTTAGYLAKAGQRVLLLAPQEVPGGELVTEEISPGFRVDACVHDAGWIPPTIIRDLGLAAAATHILRPNPILCAPRLDGPRLILWRDPQRTSTEIGSHWIVDGRRWMPFIRELQDMADVLEWLYRSPPPDPLGRRPRDALTFMALAHRLWALGRRETTELLRLLSMSIADLLDDWFESDVLKGALGSWGVKGVFQGPRSGGTAFVFLHHLVGTDRGVFGPRGLIRGGVGALVTAFVAAVRSLGGDIRFGTVVERVLVETGRVVGVATKSGEAYHARCVVSSLDPRRTFLDLLDPSQLEPDFLRAVGNIRFRGAWAKVNLALGELPRFEGMDGDDVGSLRGVICVTPSLDYLEHAYDDAKHGKIARRPSLEITIPSLNDNALAPSGKHVMSVAVRYAPYRTTNGEWNPAGRQRLGDCVLEILADYCKNIPDAVLHLQVLTPKDLAERYHLPEGNEYHGELTLDQILFMRPVAGWSTYHTPIPGLFLCGASTHPGGGIAGGAGRNAARAVITHFKAHLSP